MNSASLSKLAVHTITTRPLPIEIAVDVYAHAGVSGMTVWRDAVGDRDPARVGDLIRGAGLVPAAYVRGGFFVHPEESAREASLQDNRAILREAAAVGAPMVVLVCGAHPEVGLSEARDQIAAGIEAILPVAEETGVRLAIEPLHPMYAGDRCAVNTMASANDLCDRIPHDLVGVAVDVYHVWWDPALPAEIHRCGQNIFAFHVCDWRVPTRDFLYDRGLMGEGCIPIRDIRALVEATGFAGFNEVEIFSNELWATDQVKFLDRIVEAYQKHV